MLFLISLLIMGALVIFLGDSLRKHPAPYYTVTTAITLLLIVLDFAGVRYKGIMADYIVPMFTKGALSGALFAIIMWSGALPNGSKAVKLILPVRGRLSIIASILVFSHAVNFRAQLISLFTKAGSLKAPVIVATVCSVLLLIIMIPLFITSFMRIRRKMDPKGWKKLQRWAYVFYALIPVHMLFFTYRNILLGRNGYRLNAVVYTFVFLAYAVCRVLKAVAVKKKDQSGLPAVQLKAVTACSVLIMIMTVVLFGDVKAEAGTRKQELTESTKAETVNVSETSEITLPEKTEEIPSGGDLQNEVSGDAASVDVVKTYKDGDYVGTAFGNSGDITVKVSIRDNAVTDVEVLEQDEDEPYFTDALAVIEHIIDANSIDVDTVSGATYSSEGILEAVKNAMVQAEK